MPQTDEFTRLGVKRPSELLDCLQRDVRLAPLDRSDIRPVDASKLGDALLTKSLSEAARSDALGELEVQVPGHKGAL